MDRATLPNDFEALKAIILDQKERYESRIEYLEERVRFLVKEIFARTSEKRPKLDDPKQLHLFDEAETLVGEEKSEPVAVPGHVRQKPKRKPLPEYLPRVEVIHDIDDEQKICECGEPLSRIGEEVSEKLDIIPAKVRVIRHIRYKYACRGCGGANSRPHSQVAQLPPGVGSQRHGHRRAHCPYRNGQICGRPSAIPPGKDLCPPRNRNLPDRLWPHGW